MAEKLQFHPVQIADLILILIGSLSLLWLIALPEYVPGWPPALTPFLAILRIPLGLVYVLYAPGYLLQSAFFPYQDDLDPVERVGLSLGLSVGIIPLLALLLDWLPWGLRLWPIVIGQLLVILVLIMVVFMMRQALPIDQVYTPDVWPQPKRWWGALGTQDRRIFLFSGVILLFTLGVTAWVFLVPSDAEFMTEFYILGPEGLAENFPQEAAAGEALAVTFGCTNREREDHSYRVEAWAVDPWESDRRQLVGEYPDFKLPVGQTYETNITWLMPWAGEDQKVEFLLFIDSDPEPYRQLHLWLDVNP